MNVLLALDETTVRDGIRQSALPYVHRQPIAWTKSYRGADRVYYTNLGRNESTWDVPEFQESLVAGIELVGGVRPGVVTDKNFFLDKDRLRWHPAAPCSTSPSSTTRPPRRPRSIPCARGSSPR